MSRLLLCLLLAGCAAKRAEYAPAADYGPSGGYAPAAEAAPSRSAAGAPMRKSAAPPPPAPPPSVQAAPTTPGSPPQPNAPEAQQNPAAARMVHYQGFAELRVGHTQEGVDGVIALAKAAGGDLEQQYGNTVVVRVPVAKFREVFDAILKTGDVVRRSISAEDVTDAFTSVELRLKTAQARRDRLVQLLALSKDENEKLALVREIQDATEEIDRLDEQARMLQRLADFSRITVQIDERPALSWQGGAPEPAAFAWIRSLTPFSPGITGKKLPLDVPDGFVRLDERGRFLAESAEGARIWSDRLPNDPVGDTAYWTEALKRRLGGEFASAEDTTIGEWRGLRLVDRSDTPYVWLVLVRAAGKDLDLVEVFYPTKAAEERHASAVRAVLTGGGAS